MDALTLLQKGRSAGLHVRADGDQLTVTGPPALEVLANELLDRKLEILPLLRNPACWICGDDATGEMDGRRYCGSHLPTTSTTKALVEACLLFEGLAREWDALASDEEVIPKGMAITYFTTSGEVNALSRRVRKEG